MMARQEVLRWCEHDRMRKEEVEQRTLEALKLVKEAILATGKKGKKGGKGGKGGKKKKK
jgi:hypothetical protein